MKPTYAGLDIGASYTKCVIIDDQGAIESFAVTPTGFDFEENAKKVFEKAARGCRWKGMQDLFNRIWPEECWTLPISTRPRSPVRAWAVFESLAWRRRIIDIGGQDAKIIKVDPEGKRLDFKMNRKCAAGTGAFIEEIAFKIRIPVEELDEIAQSATDEITLGSFCTVFTATEILAHVRAQVPLPNIVRGIFRSVAKRISEMDYFSTRVIFTGGLAKQGSVLSKMIAEETGSEVLVPRNPQITCAYGAAIYARES